MRNVIITGSYPPDVCGVGDYVNNLINTSEASEWIPFYRKNWSIYKLIPYILDLVSLKPQKIFLQYPTRGYGWSLVPHFLCAFFSCFTKIRFIPILHEYSELTLKARFALNVIVLFTTKELVVTNVFEKNAILTRNKKFSNSIYIIKIFPNIGKSRGERGMSRYYDIVYFGQIHPNRGIEYFLSEVIKYKAKRHINVAIIGAYSLQYKAYFDNIVKLAKKNDIILIINRPASEISELLNNSKILFLPFPDGCSERRATYLSGLKNGCIIITTKGNYVTKEMLKTAFFISEEKPVDVLFDDILVSMTEDDYLEYQNNVISFLEKEIPHSWNEIAEAYNRI
jgi:glycosyltransferase involved in cell wall biosynthesis